MSNGFDIRVAPYCENCENFRPEVNSRTFGNNMTGFKTYHNVYCRYESTCKHIYDHIKRKLKEEETK